MPDTLLEPPPDGGPRSTVTDDPAEAIRPTVLDDATVSDPAAAAAAAGSPAPAPAAATRRRARVGCAIAAIVLTVVALVGGALGLYFFVWRYEPTARRHIPGGAHVALRIEAADVALFGPVRKHLWPLLDAAPAGKPRKQRLKAATGVSPADIREVVIASTDAASWVVLLGGRVEPGRVVPGMERVAREEGWPGWRRQDDLLLGPGGVAIAQAEDGTVVIGTDAPIVRASLVASDDWTRLGLPEKGALSFAITREAWDGLGGEIGGKLAGGRGLFRRAGRTTGSMTLGEAPRITMRVEPVTGETVEGVTGDLGMILTGLKLVTLLLPEQMGEKRALQSAQVQAVAGAAQIQADWPLDGLDLACQRLAGAIQGVVSP